MHEAGLAAALAKAIRQGGLVGRPVRIAVAGGHDEPSAFDEALRFHLGAALPEMDAELVSIVHVPSEHVCAACGRSFDAVWEEPCPACGGAGLPTRLDESVAIEALDRPGSSDPRIDDGGPSSDPRAGGHAESMEGSGVDPSFDALRRRPDGQVT